MPDVGMDESAESRWTKLGKVARLTLLAAFVLWAARFKPSPDPKVARLQLDWFSLVLGSACVISIPADLRSGKTYAFHTHYQRTENPVGFWVAIVVVGLGGAAMAIGALGDLLGLWRMVGGPR